MELALQVIGTVGFPIAACLFMGIFIYLIYKNTTKENAENMKQVQERCAAREEKLYERLAECQAINREAISTLQLYAERLGIVEEDVKDIKHDVAVISAKIN